MKSMIERHELRTNDYRVLQQLSTFVQKGMSYQADIGHHDDLVMPFVAFGWLVMQTNFQEITETRVLDGYRKPMVQASELPTAVPENPSAEVEGTAGTDDIAPLPVGVMTSYSFHEDSQWLQ